MPGHRAPASAVALAAACLLAGCGDIPESETPEASADSVAAASVQRDSAASPAGAGRDVDTAMVALLPTEGNDVEGSVRFEAVDGGGVRVHAELTGLEPGVHGFHVHEIGDCSAADASSAGPHYPFDAVEGEADRITGNLGEIEADADGAATLERTVPEAELGGPRSILGRSVVVHRRGNDPSSPPGGDAGPRVACGVIAGPAPTG